MGQIGKFMIFTGGFLVAMGIIFILLNRFMDINEFPGTVKIETGNFKLFIPILASIILSLLLTIVLNLVVRIINR